MTTTTKKVKSTQNGFIVGKLTWTGINCHKKDDVTQGWFYSSFIKLANGATVKTSKYVKAKDEYPDFIVDKMNQYASYPERIKAKEDIYVSVILKPSKDNVQFDKFTCDIDDNNAYRIGLDAWIGEVETEDTDEGIQILFKSGKSIAFKDTGANVTVEMIVSEKISDRVLKLTTENTEYPIEIIAELDESIENKAIVGTGYKMELSVQKGAKNSVASDWVGESKTKYAPDFVRIDSVLGIVKGLTYDIALKNSSVTKF